ncbi:hypothetical protein JUNP543_3386 [Acinetobacter baumannii]
MYLFGCLILSLTGLFNSGNIHDAGSFLDQINRAEILLDAINKITIENNS